MEELRSTVRAGHCCRIMQLSTSIIAAFTSFILPHTVLCCHAVHVCLIVHAGWPQGQICLEVRSATWVHTAACYCTYDVRIQGFVQENEVALEQEVARQLQRVGALQADLHRTQAAAEAAHITASVREAELTSQVDAKEAELQAARVRFVGLYTGRALQAGCTCVICIRGLGS